MGEKTLQQKLLDYHILISNGISTNEINLSLLERGFIIGDYILCKESNKLFKVNELLESIIMVTDIDNKVFITDPNLYFTKYEIRDIRIKEIIKKEQ